MINIIKQQQQDLIIGLADLYVQKERMDEQTQRLNEQIKTQRVAIEQCGALLKAGEENKDEA